MSVESDAIFKGLFAFEDIRELLRESTPKHELDEIQKEKLTKAIEEVRNSLKTLEALK